MAQEIRIQANGKKSHGTNDLSFLFNGNRSSHVASKNKKKKKNKRPGHNPSRFQGKQGKRNGKRHHGNPGFRERVGGDLGTGIGVLAGVVVPDLIENYLLPANFNAGFLGYLSDAVIDAVLWFGARAASRNIGPGIANGVKWGGVAKISFRALQDIATPQYSASHAIAAKVRNAQAQAATNGNGATPPDGSAAAPGTMGRPGQWRFSYPAAYKVLPDGSYPPQGSLGRASMVRPVRRRMP